jgi:hypothetical protein
MPVRWSDDAAVGADGVSTSLLFYVQEGIKLFIECGRGQVNLKTALLDRAALSFCLQRVGRVTLR